MAQDPVTRRTLFSWAGLIGGERVLAAKDPENPAQTLGFCIVDVLGHKRYVGRVTAYEFAGASLVRVDTPAVGEFRQKLEFGSRPEATELAPAYSTLIGPNSIHSITPISEKAAISHLEAAARYAAGHRTVGVLEYQINTDIEDDVPF